MLSREECLALLADAEIGRIAISARALPLILPVRFAMDGERIVIATHSGTTLEAATRDTVVAFEADGAAGDAAWSVHVNGVARHVTDQPSLERLTELRLPSWSSEQPLRFVTVSTDHIDGRSSVDTPISRPVDAVQMT